MPIATDSKHLLSCHGVNVTVVTVVVKSAIVNVTVVTVVVKSAIAVKNMKYLAVV